MVDTYSIILLSASALAVMLLYLLILYDIYGIDILLPKEPLDTTEKKLKYLMKQISKTGMTVEELRRNSSR